MDHDINPVVPNPIAPAGVVQQANDGAYAASVSHGEDLNASSTFGSLAELKKKAPKIYGQMVLSVMLLILHDMKEHQGRLKQIIKEGDRAAAGA